ncbi:MAG: hypothetical protein Fur0037_17110 [Planctomycetota bacterium]
MSGRDAWPFEFRCLRSGNCCSVPGGVVRVDAGEKARIAANLGLDPRAFESRYLGPDGRTLKEGLGGRCVFLEDGARAACGIYAVRPSRCREWPYWPELLEDERLLRHAFRTCPGLERRDTASDHLPRRRGRGRSRPSNS